MKEHLMDVEKDQDILILSGPKRKDFVLLTLAQYNAMEETTHLLSTTANAARLMEGIAQDKEGMIAHSYRISEPAKKVKAATKKLNVSVAKNKNSQRKTK